MATLGSTNVTRNMMANSEQPIAYGEAGLLLEVWRVSGAGATTNVGDTVAITPTFLTDIRMVQAQQSSTNNLSTNANTNVTLTLTSTMATNVNFDVWLIGRR